MIDLVELDLTVERDRSGGDRGAAEPSDRRLKVVASLAGVTAGALPFVLVLWNFGMRPLRSALPNRLFSDFFDIQARAFLDGELALPAGALGFEAFRHGGQEYMYFGAWPALLRLPVVALTERFDGRLSAPSMVLAWLLAATGASMLVWRVRALVAPDRPVTRVEAILVALLLAVVLGGSPMLYLAALPWVYSEALLWATAASLAALFGIIGVVERPSARRILFAGAMTLLAVLCRVTAGWGCGLAMLGVAAAFLLAPRLAEYRGRAWWVLAAGALPLGIGVAINYAKFGHPILIPFESQIWTELSERRRAVLDQGGVTGIRFLPATVFNYLRPDGVRLSPIFPFFTPPATPADEIGGVMLEMPYRTPSATSVMPLLFALALVGLWRTFRRGADAGAALLRVPLLGAMSILGGILFVGYIAPRYTVEFLPSLLIASVIGLHPVLDRVRALSVRRRRAVWSVAAALVAYGVVANVAIAAVTARVGEGGSSMRGLVELQHAVSGFTGHPLDRRVDVADHVPLSSEPERVLIVGDCDTMLVGTGDRFEPWVPLEMRSVHLDILLGDHQTEGSAVVVDFAGSDGGAVTIEVRDYHYRLEVTGEAHGFWRSEWFPSAPGTVLTLDLSANYSHGAYNIESPEHLLASRDVADYGQDAVGRFVAAQPIEGSREQVLRDVHVEVSRGEASPLCRDLLDAAS